MLHDAYPDALIVSILASVKTIALVGASAHPTRPSFAVLGFLVAQGYRVFPVNPGLAGGTIQGLTVYGCLGDIVEPVDMIDVFRNSEAAGGVVDEALALDPKPKVIWMQLGVCHEVAAARAEAQGLTVIMNRCPKIEIAKLSGVVG